MSIHSLYRFEMSIHSLNRYEMSIHSLYRFEMSIEDVRDYERRMQEETNEKVKQSWKLLVKLISLLVTFINTELKKLPDLSLVE